MKIAVITDVHGNLQALESIINDIKLNNVDKIICLGDIIGWGPNSKECIDLVINNNIDMALGNHELYCLKGTHIDKDITFDEKKHHEWIKKSLTNKEIEFLQKCPLYYECNIEYENNIKPKKIIFCHYLLNDIKKDFPFEKNHLKDDINLWIKYNDENIFYVIGHLHKSFNENEVVGISGDYIEKIGALTNINIVDSAGCTKDNNTSYLLIQIENSIKFKKIQIKYDRIKFEEKLNNKNYPGKDIASKTFFAINDK